MHTPPREHSHLGVEREIGHAVELGPRLHAEGM